MSTGSRIIVCQPESIGLSISLIPQKRSPTAGLLIEPTEATESHTSVPVLYAVGSGV